MASQKRLNSVCHSIAHHAVSALSYVHPHVLAACKKNGVDQMTVGLLDTEPCPVNLRENEPLRLSLGGLRDKFEQILLAEGFTLNDLSLASLKFTRDLEFDDDYCCICRAILGSNTGRVYEHIVDYLGRTRAR